MGIWPGPYKKYIQSWKTTTTKPATTPTPQLPPPPSLSSFVHYVLWPVSVLNKPLKLPLIHSLDRGSAGCKTCSHIGHYELRENASKSMLWVHFETTLAVFKVSKTLCSLHSAANMTGKQFHTSETVWHSILKKSDTWLPENIWSDWTSRLLSVTGSPCSAQLCMG